MESYYIGLRRGMYWYYCLQSIVGAKTLTVNSGVGGISIAGSNLIPFKWQLQGFMCCKTHDIG
jgi:hypothetical protein